MSPYYTVYSNLFFEIKPYIDATLNGDTDKTNELSDWAYLNIINHASLYQYSDFVFQAMMCFINCNIGYITLANQFQISSENAKNDYNKMLSTNILLYRSFAWTEKQKMKPTTELNALLELIHGFSIDEIKIEAEKYINEFQNKLLLRLKNNNFPFIKSNSTTASNNHNTLDLTDLNVKLLLQGQIQNVLNNLLSAFDKTKLQVIKCNNQLREIVDFLRCLTSP